MRSWKKLTISIAAAIAAALLLLLAVIVVCRGRRRHRQKASSATTPLESKPSPRLSLQHGLSLLRRSLGSQSPTLRFYNRQDPDFSWTLLPNLADISAAGWSRFVFLSTDVPPTKSTSLLNPTSDYKGHHLPLGSSDYMQTVRVYPRGAKYSLAKLNLPLPGPQQDGKDSSFFPAEAYFEITILHLQPLRKTHSFPRAPLMEDNLADSIRLVEEQKKEEKEKEEEVDVCIGLTKGGGFWISPPGSYPGSIGFNSTGRLNLDGLNLAPESEKTRWGEVNKTIGCGFDPNKKTVFFTVDSFLVHLVRCNSDAFSRPLFPAVAANADLAAAVNLGQRPFKYGPANARRRSERTTLASLLPYEPSPRAGFDYSGELFSMERIEESLRAPGSRKTSPLNASRRDTWEGSGDAESDLFEISLSR